MKNFILSIALLTCTAAQAQLPEKVDSTFGTKGTSVFEPTSNKNNNVGGMAIDASDRIVIVGTTDGATDDIFVMRTDKDGKPDSTFNGTGITIFDPKLGANDYAYGVDIQPDGKILVCGSSGGVSTQKVIVMRLNADGTWDNTFDTKGWTELQFILAAGSNNAAYKIRHHGDKIYVACSNVKNLSYVMRLYTDGTVDYDYGLSGIAIIKLSGNYNETVRDFYVTPDKCLMVMGSTKVSNSSYQYICMVDSTGNEMVDTFGKDGVFLYNANTTTSFRKFDVAKDGSIYVAGYENQPTGYGGLLLKVKPDGTIDNQFASGNGKAIFKVSAKIESERFYDLKILSDSNIMLVGGYRDFNNINYPLSVLYQKDGQLNNRYKGNGYSFETSFPAIMDYGYEFINTQSDGRVIISGKVIDSLQGNRDVTITRLKNFKPETPSNITHVNIMEDVNIYPNPTSGYINIKSTENIDRVELLSATGVFLPHLIMMNNTTYQVENDIPAGMYYLRIHTPKGVAVERIMLSK